MSDTTATEISSMPFLGKIGRDNLKNISFPRLIVGLQGQPGTGKTYGALTAAATCKVIVAAMEPGLSAHAGKDIELIKFFDRAVADELCREFKIKANPADVTFSNKSGALLAWINKYGKNIPADWLFILDSWTALQDNWDQNYDLEPVLTKKGEVDEFKKWDWKQGFSRDVFDTMIDNMKCHIVVTFHEHHKRDNEGKLVEKIQPLMQGGYQGKIKKHFDDFFRTVSAIKKGPDGKPVLDKSGNPIVEFWWLLRSNDDADLKCRILNPPAKLGPNPTWQMLIELMKNNQKI